MNVIVTGGAGFIGSHLVKDLLAEGHTVTAIDNFDPFYPEIIKQGNIAPCIGNPAFTLVRADIVDRFSLQSALPASADAIVHLAARAGVRPSIDNPAAYQETNVAGTQNLLDYARERGIRKFIFASSSSVYGVNPRVPWAESDSVLLPISPYASTKISGELMGHCYSHLFGIQFIALRFFTVYGPGQRPDLAIHKFARRMLEGRSIPVFGDGSTRRDYTYIGDIVTAIRSALEYDRSAYEVINVGNDRTVSLMEMIQVLQTAMGVRAEIESLPEQPGDVPQTWADISKAGKLLGYRPQTSFEDGIAAFAAWLQSADAASQARFVHA